MQTVKQTAAPVVETVKQTTTTGKPASQAVKTVAKSIPAVVPTVPPLPAQLAKPPAPVLDVAPAVHETVDPVVQETDPAVGTVVEVVEEVAAVAPQPAVIVESVVAHSEPSASQDETPLLESERPQVAPVATKPAITTPDITTVSAAKDAVIEQPASVDGPSSVHDERDAVLPIADEILAIHDRQTIVVSPRGGSVPLTTVEEWLPLPPTINEVVAATPMENAPAVVSVALEASETIERAGATPTQATPSAHPSEPPQQPQPQPVGSSSVGFSWSGAADLVTHLTFVSARGSWAKLVTVGRTLPSVIVLPNLAPPG